MLIYLLAEALSLGYLIGGRDWWYAINMSNPSVFMSATSTHTLIGSSVRRGAKNANSSSVTDKPAVKFISEDAQLLHIFLRSSFHVRPFTECWKIILIKNCFFKEVLPNFTAKPYNMVIRSEISGLWHWSLVFSSFGWLNISTRNAKSSTTSESMNSGTSLPWLWKNSDTLSRSWYHQCIILPLESHLTSAQ